MKTRLKVLVPLCLLALAGAWYFWSGGRPVSATRSTAAATTAKSPAAPQAVASSAKPVKPLASVTTNLVTRSAASTNREYFRLTNTKKTLAEMTTSPRAILLENALVDTAAGLSLNIPKQLRAKGEPGAYIVQSRGVVNGSFRAALTGAGAKIISYIPNNAYLVQLSSAGAGALNGNPQVQAVLPYQPYFKVQSSLLGLAIKQKPLPPEQVLTLGLFADGARSTVAQIEQLGGKILGTDRSPFGPVVRVLPQSDNWLALAQLPGVQRVEPATRREIANDLARVTMGIATDVYVTNANWLNLTGSNVLVEVNDTGIDANHPDFTTGGSATTAGGPPSRVIGYTTNSIYDINGHGTHVAGIIAGNGAKSYSVTNTPSGSVTNADFRGKAPAARLLSFGFLGANDTNVYYSDSVLQEIPALTNALISNNSWVNGGDNQYDLSAASYDAAVRDALPATTGPQPVLFVFPAGNDGGGSDSGFGGSSDTILSPGTAKNVITVGALEQFRDITNTYIPLGTTNETTRWKGETSSDNQVAAYSARGNVGVETEGPYGRFKPDVVAPGTFVVSTRSTTWDQDAYYNPTNYHNSTQLGYVDPTTLTYGIVTVPINAVGVNIKVVPNQSSPTPFPTNLPIYVSLNNIPDPTAPATYDFIGTNSVSIPPDSGGAISGIDSLRNLNFTYAVGDNTNNGGASLQFDVDVQIVTTNDNGNLLTVLSNLNETIGPWYYYETGTSIATPAVSGSLALLQDYFTNTLHATPSPALLKAMIINGARLTTGYNHYALTNGVNYEGWGLVNVPNSVPMGLTNTAALATNTPMFFEDQNPTNALATGDSRVYNVTVPSAQARSQYMHITLAWTDPPGNPAAGLKLVNNLDLIVTNLDTGDVYYGNDFGGGNYSVIADTNSEPDSVNNVENVILPPLLGTNYSVTVYGRNVTVNAVTLDQTNVVQDFALVISSGDGYNTNGITVTPVTPAAPTVAQPKVTFISSYTNGIYFNQLAGANAPWLSTNDIHIDPVSVFGTNASLFVGQTNQWHFYVVTNTTIYTNAAFIVFLPNTLSTPRMGVFANSTDNSTRPEADLNMFVASDPDGNAGQLTNIDLTVVSNCVYNVNGDQSSLGRGGTKFIAYSNSAPGQVYYIGVQCEDQMAAEFGFLSVFSENPFSQMQNGNQVVNGLLLPAAIPDGNNARPGVAYVFGLALYPMKVGDITVTNTIFHQSYGDLVGSLTHGTAGVILNNHNGLGSGSITQIYNDDGQPGTVHTDGPGSLRDFRGEEAIGPWLMTQVDDSQSQTGSITGFTMNIQPHKDLTHGVNVTIQPGAWYYGYVDVPVGYTNLTVAATNLPPPATIPIEMYLNYKVEPDFTNYLVRADLTNPPAATPGAKISYGPPLEPGRYFVGLYNPDTVAHDVYIIATLSFDASAISRVDWDSTGPVPLVDDAVMYDSQIVTNTDIIQGLNVGLRVDHERISDLVFHLISPDGTRYLLMENRGGQSTNGCGSTMFVTNTVTFPNFTGEPNLLSFSGTTTVLPTGDMRLNPAYQGVEGAAWLKQKQLCAKGFDTTFEFRMSGPFGIGSGCGSAVGGDGINFAVQNASPNSMAFSGIGGGSGTNSVNIFFNTFQNWPGCTDPVHCDASANSVGIGTNGAYVAQTDLTGFGINLKDGNPHTAHITFDGSVMNVSVDGILVLANVPMPGLKPAVDSSGQGWVGFDAASGCAYENQDILNWTFSTAQEKTSYLTFTEDTNLTTTPIKYATPPFVPDTNQMSGIVLGTNFSSFESVSATNYAATSVVDGWSVLSNQVSVVSDDVNSLGGSNLLALANGAISNSISTVPGQQYTLTFYYRGPGIVSWWRGEDNANDSINGNTGTSINGVTYTNAEVGDGFLFNGSNSYINVPDNPSLSLSNGITLEMWYLSFDTTGLGLIAKRGSGTGPCNYGINNSGGLGLYYNDPNYSYPGNGSDDTGSYEASRYTPVPANNVFHHLAGTYFQADPTHVELKTYIDGQLVRTKLVSGNLANTLDGNSVTIGCSSPVGEFLNGIADEVSIYDRALSSSEIHAIYQAGTTGKFDPVEFAASPSESLAEANVSLPGITNNVILGSNESWKPETITFTATNTTTPIVISGIEPGILLDSFAVGVGTQVSAPSNLYYQPEQSLDPLLGTSAFGLWQLEVLDNRAGATNNANLVSWQLHFTFANTNFSLATITNGFPGSQTNYIPGGATQWYLVTVPTNADFATNTLIFADLPLNLWWSTNQPPTTTNNPPDTELLTDSTGGSAVLSTNGSPINPGSAFMEPGGTYYLGVQNPNVGGANYAVDVTFHLLSAPPYVITEAATNIVLGGATLQATVNPNGQDATVYFEYGTTTNYGLFSTNVVLTNNLSLAQLVGIDVTNLAPPGQIYHFRAVATNIFGTNYGMDLTFTNPYAVPPPYAFTMPATLVNGSSAQLNGMATPNGYAAKAWFEWGRNMSYGYSTPPMDVGSNFNVAFVYTNVFPGINATNVPFHYRLVVSNVVGVTYGFDHIFNQGNLLAWGSDTRGQTTPIPSDLTNNLVAGIGGGADFSLALKYDGSVTAWGNNLQGQTSVPASLTNAVAVAGGENSSLALRSDRTVAVWGSNQNGQTNVPPDLTNAVAAAAGGYHCLALRDDGNPVAWGLDANSQTNIPAGLSNVVEVAAGEYHSVALKNDGTVVAWGNNADGETNVPPGLTNVVAIAAGGYHNLALQRNGTVVAWGYNGNGQTNVPSSLTNVMAIAAGAYHSLALRTDGTVVFWGDTGTGQTNYTPANLTNVFTIAAGGYHNLAVASLYGLNVTNVPPYWTNGLSGSAVVMDEMTVTNLNNAALDSNSPPQLVHYSLLNPPSFASIDSFTGVITLNPGEVDGPGTYVISTVATDNGYPPLSATNSFVLFVNEVNTPPFWTNGVPAATNYTIGVGQLLTVTNTASDSDIPTNTLTYTNYISPAATGLMISTNGIITWTPQTNGTFLITTVVTDDNPWAVNANSLSATNYITVTVTNTAPPPVAPTNITITSITFTTNSVGSNGFLLTWFAPSNDLFQVQWSDSLAPANWQAFTNPPYVSYNTNVFTSPTNTQFNFFDDGSETGGFNTTRFYRLILLQSTNVITFAAPADLTVTNGATVTVTNTATDSEPGAVLTYTLLDAPAGATMTNDVITWTNAGPAGLAARFTTQVTDNGVPPTSATNTFTVFVSPLPTITNVVVTATQVTLNWSAPTNDQFQVQWATNLMPPVTWTLLPDNASPATITSTTGSFSYTDTNAPALMKFYQLILLP